MRAALLYVILQCFTMVALAQPVPGPTLPPPVSKVVLSGYQGNFIPAIVSTVQSGATLSSAVYLKGFQVVGVYLPTITSTAIQFLTSVDGVTYYPVYSTTSGTHLSYTVTSGTFQAIDPKDLAGANYLKISMGSSEAALRTLNLSVRGY